VGRYEGRPWRRASNLKAYVVSYNGQAHALARQNATVAEI
jgi:hypothetical protein